MNLSLLSLLQIRSLKSVRMLPSHITVCNGTMTSRDYLPMFTDFRYDCQLLSRTLRMAILRFVHLNHCETTSLKQVMDGIKVSEMKWLEMPPGTFHSAALALTKGYSNTVGCLVFNLCSAR